MSQKLSWKIRSPTRQRLDQNIQNKYNATPPLGFLQLAAGKCWHHEEACPDQSIIINIPPCWTPRIRKVPANARRRKYWEWMSLPKNAELYGYGYGTPAWYPETKTNTETIDAVYAKQRNRFGKRWVMNFFPKILLTEQSPEFGKNCMDCLPYLI